MTPPPNKKRWLDLEPGAVKGHGFYVPLPLADRLRAARRVPQAIVKVASFAQGYRAVRDLMDYISREGQLSLETQSGERLSEPMDQRSLIRDWAKTFDQRANSRDVVHLIFSMPKGSDPEALRGTVRKVLTHHFAGHEAVFAIHQDRAHPHAHVALQMRGIEKKLAFRKADLHTLREVFAAAAREQGVELSATPRAARGVWRKAKRRTAHHLREKGIVPRHVQQTAQQAMNELKSGTAPVEPWEKAMARRYQIEKQAYLTEAERLRAMVLPGRTPDKRPE